MKNNSLLRLPNQYKCIIKIFTKVYSSNCQRYTSFRNSFDNCVIQLSNPFVLDGISKNALDKYSSSCVADKLIFDYNFILKENKS